MNLSVFQSMWAMTDLPFEGTREWTIPEKVAKTIEGGFDGVDIPWTPVFPSAEMVEAAQAAGVDWGVICFPATAEALKQLAATFSGLDPGPVYVNVQPNVKVFTVEEGVAVVRAMIDVARDAGLDLVFETHRDRLTTDLRFTLQLIDAVPEMRLNADLSHFVVGQEFAWPVCEDDHALIRRIVERADMFHGRVASREQVQIPISWDYHRPWLDLFLGWWEDGFRLWRERAASDDTLYFVPELGPGMWYALTGPDGKEMSDRWEEALLLKRHIREIWERLEASAEVAP